MTADELEELIQTVMQILGLPRWMARLQLELIVLGAIAARARRDAERGVPQRIEP